MELRHLSQRKASSYAWLPHMHHLLSDALKENFTQRSECALRVKFCKNWVQAKLVRFAKYNFLII